MVSLRYLQTAMEGAAELDNPEDESVGYILEKGVKEIGRASCRERV